MSNWERKINRERDRQQRHEPSVVVYRTDRFGSHTEAAIAAARASGCACEPAITTRGENLILGHDDWCPLIRSRQDHN